MKYTKMSRVGKKPIFIPENIEVKINGREAVIKGPKGEITQEIPNGFEIEIKAQQITIRAKQETKKIKSLWGTLRALLANHIKGVSEGFKKELELIGIGFKGSVSDKMLNLEVGFSHSVVFPIPEGIEISVGKNIIITGINKQKVGEVAAQIRKIRPPEPYKGKGIRYLGEKIRKKEGKKAESATK